MNKIILSENRIRASEVFGADAVIYCKADILSGGFTKTEFIFSTWGMPVFTEEEHRW